MEPDTEAGARTWWGARGACLVGSSSLSSMGKGVESYTSFSTSIDGRGFDGSSDSCFDAGLGSRFRWVLILSSGSITIGTCGPGARRVARVSVSGPIAKFGRAGEKAAGEVLER